MSSGKRFASLDKIGEVYGHQFHKVERLVGGCCIDAYGVPIRPGNAGALPGMRRHSVWCGRRAQVGPPSPAQRPESGLAALRRGFNLLSGQLARPSSTRQVPRKIPAEKRGAGPRTWALLLVRDLIGGIYFGEKGTREGALGREGYDVECYSEFEVGRVARRAFRLAQGRRKSVTSIDKSDALESSWLWQETWPA